MGQHSNAIHALPARPRPIIRATELGSASVLKEGALFLLSDAYGDVVPDRRGLGLYLRDTRVLSTACLLVEGRMPTLLRRDPGGSSHGIVLTTNPDPPGNRGGGIDHPVALPRQSIGIRRTRDLGVDAAYCETITISNYSLDPQVVRVRLLLDADGADIFEVRGYERARRGELRPIEVGEQGLRFRYQGLDGRELVTDIGFDLRPGAMQPAEDDEPGSIAVSWSVHLEPGTEETIRWSARAGWRTTPDAPPLPGPAVRAAAAVAVPGPTHQGRPAAEQPGIAIETDDELLDLILARALADLRLLSTPGPDPGERFVAAGVPWFTTLFGRDSIIAAIGALPFLPELAHDALTVLARLQADSDDPASDAEPGKILHEMRVGEMARTGELPFSRYYGSVDSTPLWCILLAEFMAWTGDGHLVDRLWPNALRALRWLEDSPRDTNGFLTYRTRATAGLRNQGWKDSADCIRDRNGAILDPPIALAEAQAYAAEARRRLATLARGRGDTGLAEHLEADAATLVGHLDERFWVPDLERYAMAVGPGSRQADALASNMGHCLWAGAVPPHRAALVTRDLTGPALFSGWGVRTYAAAQPGFNPLGYHTGSVWPHDSALAAAGVKRYGFHDEATTIAWAVLDAARNAPGFRLPELFCGYDRVAGVAPVVHPVSCAPQAWGASSALMLLTTMLGLHGRAPSGELEIVRPVLPEGLSKVVIRNLRVGGATVDLLFHRWRGTTSAEVLGRRGELRVTVRL